jgi:hypothetical protein
MDEANKQYFFEILTKYRLGEATREEIKFLESYYELFEVSDDLITDENELLKKQSMTGLSNTKKKPFLLG